jgi:hypothetical protein
MHFNVHRLKDISSFCKRYPSEYWLPYDEFDIAKGLNASDFAVETDRARVVDNMRKSVTSDTALPKPAKPEIQNSKFKIQSAKLNTLIITYGILRDRYTKKRILFRYTI